MRTRRKSGSGNLLELVLIVVTAIALALGIQAFLIKPYRIPSESMEPTLDIGQRVLVNRIGNRFTDPDVGEIVVFHPPAGAVGDGPMCGAPHPQKEVCPREVPKKASENFIKRVVAGPGDRIQIRDGRVIRNGKLAKEGFIRPCGGGPDCDFPIAFTVPPGHWFMMGDNRGSSDDSRFWGPVPKKWIIGGAFATYWPPGRIGFLYRLDADAAAAEFARVEDTVARKPRQSKRSARRLFRFDRELGTRFVAGADEAGRGCLAGPLVAAAVLFDYERIGLREVRALAALDDSKQHTPAAREELFPIVLRTATRVAIVSRCARGIDGRGLHVTNLAALRQALERVARRGCVCLSDGFPVGELDHEQHAVVNGDARSAAIAAASIVAKVTRDRFMHRADLVHPGWEFATHVGYATPEHRAAIMQRGVSPLHRLSFQSAAYQQLAL